VIAGLKPLIAALVVLDVHKGRLRPSALRSGLSAPLRFVLRVLTLRRWLASLARKQILPLAICLRHFELNLLCGFCRQFFIFRGAHQVGQLFFAVHFDADQPAVVHGVVVQNRRIVRQSVVHFDDGT
jgi:hypothetical protein